MKKFVKDNWSLILAVLYLLSPLDFIPDFILGLGFGDDLAAVLLALAIKFFQYLKDERLKKKNIIEGEVVKD